MEPWRRISLITRTWLAWPPSTGTPSATPTPSDVPSTLDSRSWVAKPLPVNRQLIQPCSTSAARSGPAPVWIAAGPATSRTRPPSSRAARIRSATWRISRALGFSEDTSEFMNSNAPATLRRSGGRTRTPSRPTTTRSPTADPVHRHRADPAVGVATTRPQSISGFSTRCHSPSAAPRSRGWWWSGTPRAARRPGRPPSWPPRTGRRGWRRAPAGRRGAASSSPSSSWCTRIGAARRVAVRLADGHVEQLVVGAGLEDGVEDLGQE